MSLMISSALTLASSTSKENFDKKSMSFYVDLNDMSFLVGCKLVFLIHVCQDTNRTRYMVHSGIRVFNSLRTRKYKDKTITVYRY